MKNSLNSYSQLVILFHLDLVINSKHFVKQPKQKIIKTSSFIYHCHRAQNNPYRILCLLPIDVPKISTT